MPNEIKPEVKNNYDYRLLDHANLKELPAPPINTSFDIAVLLEYENDPVDEYTEDMSITDDMMPVFADKNELENRIDAIISNAL